MAVTDDSTKRCDNLACLCNVALAEATCSAYCDSPEGRDPANIRCECGHPACSTAIESQLHGGIGVEST
jgi:acetone carboxylase gamma subunit